jgi:hypothetical protein
MKRLISRSLSSQRRGAVVVIVAVSMVTLLLFASLAVDVGYICALTAEQQNTADAASLAGAGVLQEGDSLPVLARIHDVISRNQRTQGFHSLEDQIIDIGIWNSVTHTFIPYDPVDWDKAFAVRVRAARNNAPLFFAAIMGKTETDVWREAVAVSYKPCGGIWGLEGVRVPGNVETDSYISPDGPYDPFDHRHHGDICSGREIRVNGSVDVDGAAMAGLGWWVDTRGQPIITGMTSATLDGIPAPPMDFGNVHVNNDNHTIGLTDRGESPFPTGLNLKINSYDNLTLAPGTYYFDDIDMESESGLTLTGPTTIYVTGNIKVAGAAVIGTTQKPPDLTIISSGAEVNINGTVEFYGQVLAPYADVEIGGDADWFGAVIGRYVKMYGTFDFHVDESLPFAKPWYDLPKPMLVK